MKTTYQILPALGAELSPQLAERRFRVQGVAFSGDEMIVTLVEASPFESVVGDLMRARLNVIGAAREAVMFWSIGASLRGEDLMQNLCTALRYLDEEAARK